MRKNISPFVAIGIICAFFCIVLGIAFLFNTDTPLLVTSGESSIGTWMSGVLLIMSASFALVLGIAKGWFPWSIILSFFFILAIDERFMFHEHIKEHIIFNTTNLSSEWQLHYELPVLFGIVLGIGIAFLLWRNFSYFSKILLAIAVILGFTSALFDIFSAGVFIEDCCKLVAELCIACALVVEVVLQINIGRE